MKKNVTITYLEMLKPDQLRTKDCFDPRLTFKEYKERQHEKLQFLYERLGEGWLWYER